MKRRDYLSMLSTGSLVGLAGCVSNPFSEDEESIVYEFDKPNYLNINEDLDIDEFNYPSGFAESLGDFSRTFGQNSAYYNSTSFYCNLTFRTRGEFTDGYRTTDRYVSDDQRRGLVLDESPTEVDSNFYTDSYRFNRNNTISREESIRQVRGSYSKQGLYLFDFTNYIQGVEFDAVGLVDDSVIRYSTSDLDQLNSVRDGGLEIIGGQIDVLIRDDGLPYALYVELHTDFRSRQYNYRFSNFDNVYIGTPEWVQELS